MFFFACLLNPGTGIVLYWEFMIQDHSDQDASK